MQAARQSAEAEAESLKAEVDAVVARQQERVADWEAAVAEEESALAAKQQELQASHAPAVPATAVTVFEFPVAATHLVVKHSKHHTNAFHLLNKCASFPK